MAFDWRGSDKWRQHPLMQRTMRYSMPGLGYGFAAFLVYVAYDKATSTGKAHH